MKRADPPAPNFTQRASRFLLQTAPVGVALLQLHFVFIIRLGPVVTVQGNQGGGSLLVTEDRNLWGVKEEDCPVVCQAQPSEAQRAPAAAGEPLLTFSPSWLR